MDIQRGKNPTPAMSNVPLLGLQGSSPMWVNSAEKGEVDRIRQRKHKTV